MIKKILNLFFRRRIYLDYASLTPLDKRVERVIRKYNSADYANSSSLYLEGVRAKDVLKSSRGRIANLVEAEENEIFFTSGGTESNNLAILGSVQALYEKGVPYSDMHVIISVIEHSSVRECANFLEEKGVKVDVLLVDRSGFVSVEEIQKKLQSNTVIVSVMTVNNEIGSVQPIRDIAKAIRHFRSHFGQNTKFNFQDFDYPIFHTDASQALLYQEVNVKKLGVDLLTMDSAKIYGPRSFGALFVKKGTPIAPIIYGGGQEYGLRSGTEDIASVAGFAKALELAITEREEEVRRIASLKDFFIAELKRSNPSIKVNGIEEMVGDGDFQKRVYSPHIINILFPGIDNEFFVLQLDSAGIACSTKSSCLGDEELSYVLNAIGANSKESVRFSLGRFSTKSQISEVIKRIKNILSRQ